MLELINDAMSHQKSDEKIHTLLRNIFLTIFA